MFSTISTMNNTASFPGQMQARKRITSAPEWRRVVEFSKWLSAAVTTTFAFLPGRSRDILLVLITLIAVDSITGVWLAARKGALKSRTFSEKLCAKLLQYTLITALGAAASVVTLQPSVFVGAVGVCLWVESLSLVENLALLEKNGGAPLGPARPFINKIVSYLAVTAGEPVTVQAVQTVTEHKTVTTEVTATATPDGPVTVTSPTTTGDEKP